MRSNGASLLATAVLLGVLALASPRSYGAGPYRLGVALGITGTGAPYSRQALEDIHVAVEEIRAARAH